MSKRGGALTCLGLLVFCLLAYEIMSYGGVRSPDSEIVFRTSDALVTRGNLAVERGLEGWPGFGVATGVDGRSYSIFGPLEAVAASPLTALGHVLADRGVFRSSTVPLPISFNVENGLQDFLADGRTTARDENGIRWVASQLNVLVTALTVVLVYLTAFLLVRGQVASVTTAFIYGFGTLAWPYSGTFFSEPLASLFVLAALYLLLVDEPNGGNPPSMTRAVCAGLCLGLATCAHVTAALFAPVFLLYAAYPIFHRRNERPAWALSAGFAVGLGVVLILLGFYNFERFGSFLETGRTVDPRAVVEFDYGVFTSPFQGLYGLLLAPNKGLLLFAPIVVLAVFAWPRMHRQYPILANMLAGAVVFRILFIASRSDWHGGFSLGPRHLVMVLPLVCLPLGFLVQDAIRRGRLAWGLLVSAAWLAVCQQYYFALGEIFSFYYLKMWQAQDAGQNPFAGNQVYLQWTNGSLSRLLAGPRGPWVLRQVPLDNQALFILGCGIFAVLAVLAFAIGRSHVIASQKPAR